MHEASGENVREGAEGPDDLGAGGEPADATRSDSERIEALPLVERAPRYQAVADRLRAELERSDPARGDA